MFFSRSLSSSVLRKILLYLELVVLILLLSWILTLWSVIWDLDVP
jgi:hypothetical protein